MVRMAECHQKLGDAEARKIYEQVVREYGDQKEAAEARTRLVKADNTATLARLVWSTTELDMLEGSVSDDGRLISYADHSTGDLAIYNVITGENRRLTHKGTWQQSSDFAGGSAFSPDGRQDVYEWYSLTESHRIVAGARLA